jgi:oxygen-dependent protoporphyrinogen oxidase
MRELRAKRAAAAAASEGGDGGDGGDGGEGRKGREARPGRDASTFVSLKRGVGDLVVNLAHRLGDVDVTTSCRVTRVTEREAGDPRGRWSIETDRGAFDADHVCLGVPAHAAAGLVATFDDDLASMLGEIAYASTATIFLAFRKFDVRHPLDAAGFLVPRAENRPILACTFVSSKWEHRAPAGQVLLRVFVGGAGNEAILANDDAGLIAIAREQLRALLGIERAPGFTKVFRFDRASPQPYVGHLARMRRLYERVATHPGLAIGGNGYVGTGIPDAIKQGEEMAARILGAAP